MRRVSPPLLRIVFRLVIIGALSSVAFSQSNLGRERETVLGSLAAMYGKSVDERIPTLAVTSDYVVIPGFSSAGVLIEISIEPKGDIRGQNTQHPVQLTRAEFDSILARLDSVKPIGSLEEDAPARFVSGGTASGTARYGNGYLATREVISSGRPLAIAVARIYYLHPVTGIAETPSDSNHEDAGSFGLVCVAGQSYMAPKSEFLKLRSEPNKPQTVDLAGPTGNGCYKAACKRLDEVLFNRGASALEHNQFTVAALEFQTLVNTYPAPSMRAGRG